MAHSPVKKAAVVADLLAGISQRAAAKKHKLGVTTIRKWADEIKATQKGSPAEIKRTRYEDALEGFAVSIFNMLKAQAELMADLDYVRKQDTEDVISHSRFLADRLVAFAELHKRLSAPAEDHSAETAALPGVAEGDSS